MSWKDVPGELVEGEGKVVLAKCPFCNTECKWASVRRGNTNGFASIQQGCDHMAAIGWIPPSFISFKPPEEQDQENKTQV